ncbi:hypothetical protein PGT21_020471 [Puccinia graminis f. sp. tritici]|uniref:Uncharacterized protein n=2 Tax=Puccinia graminis f. sp. tritici TaxID=56615 RepID=H6QSZ8_PUCGT|nr:uncharacterized protein PGTG_21968 [Puccinia graminis f. sp. tritici CRL 75-36-700-3]EHS63952.1 hypothetical protein PGTG_21968 [Puccinia graminis f. sp. tritici CRL 75-36-700-3]KAA1077805.1 hypothetical protein PGT21_020471 [Puccinia graminis f. sp. tritici]
MGRCPHRDGTCMAEWERHSGPFYLVIESSQTVDVARQALQLVTALDSTSLNRPALKDELIFSATFLD